METATTPAPDANNEIDFDDKSRLVMTLSLKDGLPKLKIGGQKVEKDGVLFDEMNQDMSVPDSVTVKVKKCGDWKNVVVKSKETGSWSKWDQRKRQFDLAAQEGELDDIEFKVVATVHADTQPPATADGGWTCTWNADKQVATWKLDPIVRIRRKGFTT